MKGFDVLHVKSAVKTRNKFDLSRTHLTTMDFGQIVPLLCEETVPGDQFNIGAEYFSRMAPLVRPTYGKFSFKTVSAFVPYHQIAWDSDAWLAGKTTWEGITPTNRFITITELSYFFRTYCLTTTGATSANADYSYIDNSGTTQYMIFTTVGKYWAKVMNSLGYAMPEGVDLRSTSYWSTSIKSTPLSFYPVLAFFKLYNDYMSQSQRFNTSALSNILQCIKYGKSVSGYTPATGACSSLVLKNMFDCLFLNYENDYFTSAWQNPNTALNAVESISSAPIPGSVPSGAQVEYNANDNYINQSIGSTNVTIGQRALDFLKSFDDWVRRNNYSGSRAVQQVYSRFGIKTD